MSPLNRGPLLGPRMPPVGMRPPLPRFGGRLPMPGMPPRMPPSMGAMFGPMRQRIMPPRPGPMMRPGGPPPPLFGPRGRGVPPLMPPMMGLRGMGPRGPLMRPGPRGLLPPQGLPHMRPRFPMGNGNIKMKTINNAKKASKLEELELKKPWMTDEIRNEIQKKNKLYAKAKKNKDAKEWDEFKDLRNKVTRMIRDAKNEYLAKNPEQAHTYEDDDQEPYDQRDENYVSSEDDEEEEEDDTSHYCEVCDREFETMELLHKHVGTHRTCGIDECTFSAHPKLVEKHISLQHCTGLYNRMKNLSTPEDIQKWIVERKKKYPTKLIVERKKAEQMEKIKRGEIIEKQMKPARDSRKKPGREKKKRNIRKRKTKERVVKPEPTVQLYRGLLPFAGTANLPQIVTENGDQQQLELVEKIDETELADFTCNISDEEDEPIPVRCVKVPSQLPETPLVLPEVRPAVENQSALGSLMANYGSDSEDDEPPDEVPIKRIKMDIPVETESPKAPKEPFAELAHDQRKIEVQEKTEVPQKVTSDRRKNSKTPRDWKKPQTEEISSYPRTIDGNHYSQKRLMLLQRLLSRSIQHERNLICQCIKYIADNNFFSDDA